MPYVPKFTPKELKTVLDTMAQVPPGEIERRYRVGEITLDDKIHYLSLYGNAEREAAILGAQAESTAKTETVKKMGGGATGEVKFYAQGVMNEFKASWDAANAEGGGKKAEAVLHGLMGSLKMLEAYNIPGDVVERWSLELFPDSPGFARAANWATWIPTNFFGISTLLKAPFKAAEKLAKAGVVAGAKIADEMSFMRNPVEYALKQSQALEAGTATKLAKATAENATRKPAAVAGATIEAEAKGGTQAFATAAPEAAAGPTQAAMPAAQMATPQDLEAMTVKELIKHYEERATGMVRHGVSHEQTRAAASAKPINFDEIIARGPDAPISATELEAIGRVHKQVSDAFNSVVDDASKHLGDIRSGARPDLVESYKAHLAAMEMTNPAFLSGRGQAGRGLEYLKTQQDLIGQSLTFDTITRALGAEHFLNGSNEAMAYTIQKVAGLSKDGRAKLLEEASKGTTDASTLRLFYKSLIFANPGTHVANIVGNTGSILVNGVNKTASSLMPFSDVTMREAAANWSGMFDARKKFLELYQQASDRAGSSLEKAGIQGTATGKMVKYGPLGWLGFEDEFMGGWVGHGLAKGKATVEGLSKWDELQDAVKAGAYTLPAGTRKKEWLGGFVDEAMANPENYKRLIGEVQEETDKILFRSPLSNAGENIARGIRESKLDYYFPVVKFPINAIKMARDWTPGFNMLSKDFVEALAEGGAKEAEARSRMTLSWMMTSQIYEAAKMGYITGGGPVDPKSNDAWRKAGNTPYSINGVPVKWAPPFGDVVGFIADLAHVSGEMEMDKLEGAASTALISMERFVESNYWLRVMDGITGAVNDVKQVGSLNDTLFAIAKVAAQPLKTLVTGGGLGRRVGEMMDPQSPDTRSYGELADLKTFFFAGTPFGVGGRPRLTYSGDPALVPPILGANWIKENLGAPDSVARGIGFFTPAMRENQPGEDPVAEFLTKHEVTLHNNWKHYGGSSDPDSPVSIMKGKPRVNLTGDEAYDWEFLSKNHVQEYGTGRTWREAIAAFDADPEFNKLTREEKQTEVNNLYTEFREEGKDLLRQINPNIAAKEAQRDAMEAAGQSNPGIMPGIEKSIFGREQPQPEQQPQEQPVERAVEYQPTPLPSTPVVP